MDLDASNVIMARPSPNSAAVVNLQDCLPEELKDAIQDPRAFLLPETELPERHRGSRVRATDDEWYKIVKAGYDRGMFTAVRDEDVPLDRAGHLITNGAGAGAAECSSHVPFSSVFGASDLGSPPPPPPCTKTCSSSYGRDVHGREHEACTFWGPAPSFGELVCSANSECSQPLRVENILREKCIYIYIDIYRYI